MKNLIILGVSGSIGTQALEVVRRSDDINLMGFSVNKNTGNLKAWLDEFQPDYVAITDEAAAEKCALLIQDHPKTRFFSGRDGLKALAAVEGADMVLTSVMGLSGLEATLAAIDKGRDIALANKETLVGAGSLVMKLAREKGVRILPVDSEHSAIFQCLSGYGNSDIKRLILTASGGPFRGKTREELQDVTVAEALNHPNWTMGRKITIDSATLMNKGLEVIEAKWLFDVSPKAIEVHVHPESIIHSAVEFKDNSVIAQLGNADMKLPIQYALNYPQRKTAVTEPLDLFKIGRLTFEKPDTATFPCLSLAYRSLEEGGLSSLILNAADEIAVELFLAGKIPFLHIPQIIEDSMERFKSSLQAPELSDILRKDGEVRQGLRLKYA